MKTKITFVVPSGADFDAVERKVRDWANRKPFGISWSLNRLFRTVEVEFWPEKSTPARVQKAALGLERILKRCSPTLRPTLPPVPPTSCLPNPKFQKGSRVVTLLKGLPGEVIARFEDDDKWTYVVHMDQMYESSIHRGGANRAVYTESFLLPEKSEDLLRKRALHGIRYSTPVQMPGGTKRSKRSA